MAAEMEAVSIPLDDGTGRVPSPAEMAPPDGDAQAPMTDGELIAYMDRELAAAQTTGDISLEREDGLRYYNGHKYGNEQEGRSQVVSRDVLETVEWIMDMLMPMFTSGDRYVEFDAVGEEDEEAAQQETDFVDYVIQKQNRGYFIFEQWFKDALLSKNGAVIAYPKKSTYREPESYRGLNALEFAELMNDPSVEPVAWDEREEVGLLRDEMTGATRQIVQTVFDLDLRRSQEEIRECVENIPPEELLVSADCRSVYPEDARLIGRRRRITESDLVEMGYDPDEVRALPSEEPFQSWMTNEHAARYDKAEEYWQDPMGSDRTRRLWMVEAYLKVDYDRDGVAERRRILRAGNRILENEEVDRVPIYALTPYILTHKFFGHSVADLVKDIQLIRSTLWRQMLDNLYWANNPEEAVWEDGCVDYDEWGTSTPGGKKRTNRNPHEVHKSLERPFVAHHSFAMFDYLDSVAKNRTGAASSNAGPDANALQNINTGVYHRDMDIAERKVARIGRIFAETGVTELFRGIHRDLQKNQNKPKAVRLRGQWVNVSPQAWRDRMDMTVNTGLGTGTKDAQMAYLSFIRQDQQELAANGSALVDERNMYNARRKMVESSGLRNVDLYYTDPESEDGQRRKAEMAEQAQAQAASQAQMMQAQMVMMQAQIENMEKRILVEQGKLLNQIEKQADDSEKWRTELEVEQQTDVPGAAV